MPTHSQILIAEQNKLIAAINEAVPEALATPISEYSLNYKNCAGIWFRGSEDYARDNTRIFDYYSISMFHPAIEKLAHEHGFYIEAHNAGTMMAWPI